MPSPRRHYGPLRTADPGECVLSVLSLPVREVRASLLLGLVSATGLLSWGTTVVLLHLLTPCSTRSLETAASALEVVPPGTPSASRVLF
jgi:hypothetical protein